MCAWLRSAFAYLSPLCVLALPGVAILFALASIWFLWSPPVPREGNDAYVKAQLAEIDQLLSSVTDSLRDAPTRSPESHPAPAPQTCLRTDPVWTPEETPDGRVLVRRIQKMVPEERVRETEDGVEIQYTVCKPMWETETLTTPPEFRCYFSRFVPLMHLNLARIAFYQAEMGEQIAALETLGRIVDDWYRGHILVDHLMPWFDSVEQIEAAIPLAESIETNLEDRVRAFGQIAVRLQSATGRVKRRGMHLFELETP